jgi:putative MATE family efflux protein
MAVIGGLVVMALGEIFSKPILSLLNIPDDVFDMALTYLRIYILGMPMFFIYNFEAAIFRSNGDSKTPLIVLAMSGLLNVILNVVFVVVIGMKVEGVAIATIVSNAVSTIVLFIILLNTKQVVRITFKKIRIDVKTMWEIIKIGVPSSIQSCMYSVANIILQTGTNSLGSVAMAGASTANNITAFAWFTLSSFGQASTTFTGQNNGAGNMKRCKKSLYLSLGIGMIVLVVVASLLMLFDDTLFAIFNKDPAVWEYARIGMYYILLSYPCSLIQDTCSGYLRGFGHSFIPAVIAIMCICVFRILWIVFVFPMYNTYSSIAIVYPITLTLTAIATVVALLIMRPAKKRELEIQKMDSDN